MSWRRLMLCHCYDSGAICCMESVVHELETIAAVVSAALNISQESLLQDLKFCLEEGLLQFKKIYLEKDILVFQTDTITLSDSENSIDFGPFKIYLNYKHMMECSSELEDTSLSYFLSIEALSRPKFGADEYPHPHVHDAYLCFGKGEEAVYKALARRDLASAAALTYAVLNMYNAGDCYKSLNRYLGASCDNCGDLAEITCDCGNECCKECMNFCSVCKNYVCWGCIFTCVTEELVCRECLVHCEDCGDSLPQKGCYELTEVVGGKEHTFYLCNTCRKERTDDSDCKLFGG